MPLRLLAPANACESLSQYVTRTRMVPCRVTSYYMWHEGSLVRRTLCALPALHLTDTPEHIAVANVQHPQGPFPEVRAIMVPCVGPCFARKEGGTATTHLSSARWAPRSPPALSDDHVWGPSLLAWYDRTMAEGGSQ